MARCPTILIYYCSIDSLPSKKKKSSGSSKTLRSESSAKTIEPTVQVKSKKKAKNISMALEVAKNISMAKRDSLSEVKRDYTWEPSSEDGI